MNAASRWCSDLVRSIAPIYAANRRGLESGPAI
jgi:hypothetical protein